MRIVAGVNVTERNVVGVSIPAEAHVNTTSEWL